MNLIPHEFTIGGVYFPPLLIAALLGVAAAALTVHALNRYRMSRFFFYPPLVFLGLSCLGRIPFDPVFTKAMIQAQTVFEYDGQSTMGEAIRGTWQRLVEKLELG